MNRRKRVTELLNACDKNISKTELMSRLAFMSDKAITKYYNERFK